MKKFVQAFLALVCLIAGGVSLFAVVGRAPTSHPAIFGTLGKSSSSSAMERSLEQPGPLQVETVVGADWQIDRSGLIDLSDPAAKEAGLHDGAEPIKVLMHAVHHPTRGLFLVDTGVERQVGIDPGNSALGSLLPMVSAPMKVQNDTATWLGQQDQPVAGVLLTHLHIDHVMGIPDLDPNVPLYAGPGETSHRNAQSLVTAPIIDRELAGKGPIQEWAFEPDPDKVFAGVIDVFGDASLWALWVPGHTAGSTAYLARTPSGPVLFTGDVSHTRWGWDHHVPPGSFSADRPQAAASFKLLQALATRHPNMQVRLGHQL